MPASLGQPTLRQTQRQTEREQIEAYYIVRVGSHTLPPQCAKKGVVRLTDNFERDLLSLWVINLVVDDHHELTGGRGVELESPLHPSEGVEISRFLLKRL